MGHLQKMVIWLWRVSMRLILSFKTKHSVIPLDYRPTIISFFKGVLQGKYPSIYEELYTKTQPKIKSYCFSTYFKDVKIIGKTIVCPSCSFTVTVSTGDVSLVVFLYNSLIENKKKTLNIKHDNEITLIYTKIVPEIGIYSDNINITFLSPLVVRDHNKETNIDKYLYYDEDNFFELLNLSIKNICESFNVAYTPVVITPINAGKTVVYNMGKRLSANTGTYRISGSPEMLNFLYSTGIGSRRGQGFGLFEIKNNA
jgi:CRISPR-associated endoribonuclease Cas6